MAKKRTKKDRLQSDLRRQKKNIPLKQEIKQEIKLAEKEVKQEVDYLKGIFAYDPQLIVKDLKKTFLVFIFILLVLLTVALLYT